VFGSAGAFVAIAFWTPVIFRGGELEWLLFIGIPALSAAASGAILGRRQVLRARSATWAALTGAGIASLAIPIFASLFSALYAATQPPTEHWNALSLSVLVFAGTIIAVGWIVAAAGAIVGYILYRAMG
jgi:hypothetical protein